MRLIDADALTEKMNKKALDLANGGMIFIETINNVINNAPTVDITETISKFRNTAYQNGFTTGLNKRPQGEWHCPSDDCAICSVCKAEYTHFPQHSKFCGECGAAIKGLTHV